MAISYIAEKIHDLKQNVTFTTFSLAESASVVKQHQHKEIDFPENPKGRSFQASWHNLYPWLHYELQQELVSPWQDNVFVTKGFQNWKKSLYSEKDKPWRWINLLHLKNINTVKAVRQTLREERPYSEFFWSVFSRIRIEHGEIRSTSLYSVQMQGNTDQKNSE